MLNMIKYIEDQLLPMGLILILFLSIFDSKFVEKLKTKKQLKILTCIIIAMYYIEIFVKVIKIGFFV